MEERPLSYALAIVWSMATLLVLIALMQLTVWLRPAGATDIVNLGAVEALAFTFGTFAILRVHAAGRPARAALGLRPTHPALSVLGIALGITLQVPAGSLRQLVEHHAPTPEAELASRAALLTGETVAELVIILCVTACVAPLVEELFARGALFGSLCRNYSVEGAAGISALCFVLVHVEWRNWPALLVVAGTLSHLRAASGSLLPCLGLHVAFNTATIVALFSGISSVTRPLQFSWPVTAAGWVATAVLVFAVQQVARRSTQATRARLEDTR